MARMKPPTVPAKPVPIVPADRLKRLFAACAGAGFEARRDTALIMLLLDTGARRAEMVGLKLTDVDLDLDVLLVLGKGRRERTLPFGRKAGEALDRWPTGSARPARRSATDGWAPAVGETPCDVGHAAPTSSLARSCRECGGPRALRCSRLQNRVSGCQATISERIPAYRLN